MNSGDTAWVLMATALVMLMTPGLAFFYGGMVRKKNVLNILMQCFFILCMVSVLWIIYGYSLSFGTAQGFWGGFDWVMLKGVSLEPFDDYSKTIPHQAYMIFQCMFAVVTPALIIGGFAERMKFSSFVVYMILWLTFVYAPICHSVWSVNGYIHNMGALDFAGGTVVHINAGIAALVTAIVIGRRKYTEKHIPAPHNLPFVMLGTALLWFGWFGFNAGSALSANGIATNAFVVTNTAAAIAGIGWASIEWYRSGKPTLFGIASGSVAGLVAITPAAGYVNVFGALIIGLFASVLCYIASAIIKPMLRYDDALDAFGIHCISGIWGALGTGLFAVKAINPDGADGLFYGNPELFLIQIKAVLITLFYSGLVTSLICVAVDLVMGLRIDPRDEEFGLDLSEHHERAYSVLE